MEVEQLVLARRSVRRFLEKPVDDETLKSLLMAGMQAPSARNEQPWQFLLVRDAAQKRAIAAVQPHAKPAASAPVALVLLADLAGLPGGTKYWPQDLAACAQNILLQAAAKGLGAVWLGMYPDGERVAALQKLLALPKAVVPFCVIALGHPAEAQEPPPSRYDPGRVHKEQYGNPWRAP